MIGKTILHYKILEKLGAGGMGIVYKAEDTKLKRAVAIKFLPRQIAASDEERARFKVEAQAAAALNHPNIATIHNIEEVDDDLFIVMEYIEGKELREIVQSEIPNPKSAIDYASQIAEGLQAAHEKGVVHRDIKSSNIMVTENGKVKIMDFGLARIGGGAQLTKDHSTLGTTAYMSPEQARGAKVDHRTDIWAFGVVLYEMLTGQLPFRGEYEQAVVYSIMNEEPEYPSDLPASLKTILERALAKDSAQRFQHVGELLANLGPVKINAEPDHSKTTAVHRRPRSLIYLLGGAGLLLLILAVWFLRPTGPTEPTIDSIAVLPLANLSGDPAQEYFSDGMTEALITDLSKISALKVISRTSVMQYKNAQKPLPEIAHELGVQAIIAGSVMRDGDRVRITAQLTEAETDHTLWARSYERDLADVFALQRDIARAIAAQVRVTLKPGEAQQLQEGKSIDPAAYEAYLKGVYHDVQYNPSDFLKSLDYFTLAVEKEPEFTLGYLGIVRASTGLMDLGGRPFSELYPLAKSALDKALQLGESRAEVYGIEGRFKHIAEWDWAGAEAAFRRSLELNPNLSTTYFDYASFLISMDRRDEALSMIKKARSLDPLNAGTNNDVGWISYCVRRYDDAIREYRNNLEMYPDFVMSHRELSWVYAKAGRFPEALASVRRAVALERSAYNLAQLVIVQALAGHRKDALQTLAEVYAVQQTEQLAAYEFAMIYTALEDYDAAFEWLEKAYQEHSGWPFLIKVDPLAEALHSDPRYGPFMKRMGLEP
jgi:serine/threonine-protein kinase